MIPNDTKELYSRVPNTRGGVIINGGGAGNPSKKLINGGGS